MDLRKLGEDLIRASNAESVLSRIRGEKQAYDCRIADAYKKDKYQEGGPAVRALREETLTTFLKILER